MRALPVLVAFVIFTLGFGVGQRVFKTEDSRLWGGALIGGGALTVAAIIWAIFCVIPIYFPR